MVSLARVQPSKRRPGGPEYVVRHDSGENQYYQLAEAELALSGALRAGHLRPKTVMPFSHVVREFLKERAAEGYAKSTLNGDRYHASFLIEEFGERPIYAISRSDIWTLHAKLLDYHSNLVAPAALNLLSHIMYYAMEHQYVTADSCFDGPHPPLPPISSARTVPARYRPIMPGLGHIKIMLSNRTRVAGLFAAFGLLQGLRAGETLGMDWDAVDWGRNEFDVRQSTGAGGNGDVKTLEANRILPMTACVGEQLRMVHIAAGYPTRGPIFVNKDGKRMSYESAIRRFYQWQCSIGIGYREKILKEAGSPSTYRCHNVWTSHALRHAAAALMIRAGVPDVSIQAFLGHAYLDETLETYAYLFDLREAGFDVFAPQET